MRFLCADSFVVPVSKYQFPFSSLLSQKSLITDLPLASMMRMTSMMLSVYCLR